MWALVVSQCLYSNVSYVFVETYLLKAPSKVIKKQKGRERETGQWQNENFISFEKDRKNKSLPLPTIFMICSMINVFSVSCT